MWIPCVGWERGWAIEARVAVESLINSERLRGPEKPLFRVDPAGSRLLHINQARVCSTSTQQVRGG